MTAVVVSEINVAAAEIEETNQVLKYYYINYSDIAGSTFLIDPSTTKNKEEYRHNSGLVLWGLNFETSAVSIAVL